jgi:predicted permease
MDETRSRFAGAPGALPAMLAGAGAAVIGVLALACVNVAVLLLARGASRTRELTIRLALGASRGRVLRQLAVESLLIAALGTLIAGAMISIALRVAAARYPEGVPAVNLAIDWRVASFAVIAAALASLLFGLAPGAHAIKLAIADGLKGRAAAIRRGWFVLGARELLIVLQVAASVALVLAAGLVADAFVRGSAASTGFQTTGVTTVSVDLATDDQARMLRLSDALLDRAQRTRGVASVAIAGMLPLMGSSITVEARPEAGEARVLEANVVSSGYFATLRIPVKAGRDFSAVDRRGSRDVAIASETLARTVWQTPNVIGRTLTIDRRIVEIIGVVADTRYRAIAEPFRPVVYLPVSQWPAPHFVVHARGAADGATAAALERALRSIDPTILVDTALPLTARLDSLRGAERFAQAGAGAAGIAQLALVLMALWALVAYAVERRRVEIGIRMALGATAGGILRLMLRPAVLLILVGSVAGTALGIVTASVLQANFVGLDELQPIAGLPIVALLVIVATAAALVPARRAARVDPMHALRAE